MADSHCLHSVAQSQGFKNCYLKTTVTSGGLLAKTGIDSAIVAVDNSAPAASSPPALGAGVAETPAPVPVVSSVVIMTTTVSSPGGMAVVMTTATATATATPGVAAEVTAGGSGADAVPTAAPSSSNAWIAAPVIGGLAAVTLVLALFILWGRRRGRAGGMGDGVLGVRRRFGDVVVGRAREIVVGRGGGEKYFTDEESGGLTSSAATSAPPSRRGPEGVSRAGSRRVGGLNVKAGTIRVLSGSGRRVGHEPYTVGTGPGLNGMDIGIALSSNTSRSGSGGVSGGGSGGGSGDGGGRSGDNTIGPTKADTDRRRSSSGSNKSGLRDSQNGLRLNGLSVHGITAELAPGIPQGFAGPDKIGKAS